MTEECLAQNLPPPEFAQVGGEFHVTFRKDAYTDERLTTLGLSARQIQAVRFVQQKGSISDAEYRDLTSLKERTASSDLADLIKRDIFVKPQKTGRGARYTLKNPQQTRRTHTYSQWAGAPEVTRGQQADGYSLSCLGGFAGSAGSCSQVSKNIAFREVEKPSA